jgi:hypothetical protein
METLRTHAADRFGVCFFPNPNPPAWQGIFRESRQTRGDEDLEVSESGVSHGIMAIDQFLNQLDKDHSGIIAYDEWENFMVQFIRRRCDRAVHEVNSRTHAPRSFPA